jgi:hypothetical protein
MYAGYAGPGIIGTMPGSGLFRVTEEPIHRSPVIAAFGQVCLRNRPA